MIGYFLGGVWVGYVVPYGYACFKRSKNKSIEEMKNREKKENDPEQFKIQKDGMGNFYLYKKYKYSDGWKIEDIYKSLEECEKEIEDYKKYNEIELVKIIAIESKNDNKSML